MSDAEFDRHARSYAQLHEQNIAIVGEEPQYFADYKMRDFRALVDSASLPRDGTYLDFGCGVGASVEPFALQLPDARLVCIDVSSESLAMAQQRHGAAADFRWMSGPEGPVDAGLLDGAFACRVFHHIPHDQHLQVLQQLKRSIRPGGLLMVYEHNPFNPLTVRAVRTCH